MARRDAGRLVQPAERQAHSFGVIVVGADKAGSADRTEMLCRELRGMKCLDEFFSLHPCELAGLDGRAGAEGGAMPAPASRAVTVEDRTELALDPVLDAFAKAATRKNLGRHEG